MSRLVANRLARPAKTGEVCPDAEVLAAYVDGGLSSGDVHAVDVHLTSCAACRSVLARLSPIETESVESTSASVHLFRRLDPKWLSLAASLLIGGIVWMAWPGRHGQTPESTVADLADTSQPKKSAMPSLSAPGEEAKAAAPSTAESERDAVRGSSAPVGGAAASSAAASSTPSVSSVSPDRGRSARSVRAAQSREPSRQAPSPLARVAEAPADPSPSSVSAAPAGRPVAAAPPPPFPAPAVAEARREAAARADDASLVGGIAPGTAGTIVPAEAAALQDSVERARPTDADVARGRQANKGSDTASRQALSAAAANVVVVSSASGASAGVVFMEPERRLWWRILDGTRVESSSDGGVTWRPSPIGRPVRLLAGSAPEIGVAWVAGAGGVILRRVVPGPWTAITTPTSDDIVAIAATSESTARVTARAGQVYETTDGGATWTTR